MTHTATTEAGPVYGSLEDLMSLVEKHVELKRGWSASWIPCKAFGGFQYIRFDSKGREVGLSSDRFHRGVIVKPVAR